MSREDLRKEKTCNSFKAKSACLLFLFFWPIKMLIIFHGTLGMISQYTGGGKTAPKWWIANCRIRLYMKCFPLTGKVCARLHSWGIITVSVGPTSCLALALSCWTFKKHFRSSSSSSMPFLFSPLPRSRLLFSRSRDNDKSASCRLILMFDSGRRGRFPNARVECLSFQSCSSLDGMVPWLWCTAGAPAHSWNEESLVWLPGIYNVQNKRKSLKRSSHLHLTRGRGSET